MLPIHTGPRRAAAWIGVHTLLTALVALLLAVHPALRLPYLIPVSLVTLGLVYLAVRLLRHPEGGVALTLFKFSNAYLVIVLVILIYSTSTLAGR